MLQSCGFLSLGLSSSGRALNVLLRGHGAATANEQKQEISSSGDNSSEEDVRGSPTSRSSDSESPSHRSTEGSSRDKEPREPGGRAGSSFFPVEFDEPDAEDELATDSAEAFVSPGERRLQRHREYMQSIEDSLF